MVSGEDSPRVRTDKLSAATCPPHRFMEASKEEVVENALCLVGGPRLFFLSFSISNDAYSTLPRSLQTNHFKVEHEICMPFCMAKFSETIMLPRLQKAGMTEEMVENPCE